MVATRMGTRPRRVAVATAVLMVLALWPAGASANQHERTAEPPEPRALAQACPRGGVPDAGFTDVSAGSPHARAVDCAAWYGIAQGGPGGRPASVYGPGSSVRRDQMASFIARFVDYADEQLPGELLPPWDGRNRFGDVPADNPHAASINRLAAAGVVAGGPGGRSANEFGPGLTVRRDQMASFINRSLEVILPEPLTAEEVYFDDLAGVLAEHADNINALAEHRITAGRQADGRRRYVPGETVRRDEMASFLMRAMDLLVELDRVAPQDPEPPQEPPSEPPAPQEVARFSTFLPPNPDRTHNIHLAADYMQGDVIAAGATYSLNHDGIGERTTARGFRLVENGCIGTEGEPVDCVGGGTSQMATTFMNVAWFTGVELVEFRQHTIYFPRYPVCHEATLSWGSLDVVVHNNSPHDIVVDTFYDEGVIGVRFLSQEWAQVESWVEPAEPPASGPFASSCGRTITYPDGTTDTESYQWSYDGVGF